MDVVEQHLVNQEGNGEQQEDNDEQAAIMRRVLEDDDEDGHVSDDSEDEGASVLLSPLPVGGNREPNDGIFHVPVVRGLAVADNRRVQNVLQNMAQNMMQNMADAVAEAFQAPALVPLNSLNVGVPENDGIQRETFELFQGSFGYHNNLLVKRSKKPNVYAMNEADMMLRLDREENVVHMVTSAQTDEHLFIAVIRSGMNLRQMFQGNLFQIPQIPAISLPKVILQLFKALESMAKYGIRHRDISLDNIYMDLNSKVTLSGFKYGRLNTHPKASYDIPLTRLVWTYPFSGQKRYTANTEVFLMGCVSNCLVNRRVLSYNNDLRAQNAINAGGRPVPLLQRARRQDMQAIEATSWQERCAIMFNRLVTSERIQRMALAELSTENLSHHYLFWDLRKTYEFVLTCYNYLEGYANQVQKIKDDGVRVLMQNEYDNFLIALEQDRGHLFNDQRGWLGCIENPPLRNMLRGRPQTVYSLIQTIRHRGTHHFEDWESVRRFFQAVPEEYIAQWLRMFPSLVPHLVRWTLSRGFDLQEESFRKYFASRVVVDEVHHIPMNGFTPMYRP